MAGVKQFSFDIGHDSEDTCHFVVATCIDCCCCFFVESVCFAGRNICLDRELGCLESSVALFVSIWR